MKFKDYTKIREKFIDKDGKYSKEQERVMKLFMVDYPKLEQVTSDTEKVKIAQALAEGDIAKYIKEQGYDGIKNLATAGILKDEALKTALNVHKINMEAKGLEDNMKSSEKEVSTAFGKLFDNIASQVRKKVVGALMEFDAVIHKTQQETGIMFTQNTAKMADLTSKTAQFGMSIEDTAKFMGGLGDELKTTDFNVLAKAADSLKAVQLATGASTESITAMAGEMMRMGDSSEDVERAMKNINVAAKQFGVSSKGLVESVSKNLDKMRKFGFTGGVESLTKMTAQAQRLRMNVDEIFNVADKARSIEGAMDMAAELQLAGGSFANINPMDLLSAARKGPAELQKILTEMGKDVGHFDEKTKEFKFDPVDVDRLQIVAKATGQSLDSIQKMIQKNAEDAKKFQLIPNDIIDMKDFDPEAVKATLSDSLDIGKDGKIQVKAGSLLDAAGIKDVSKMSKEQLRGIMEDQKKKDANLEAQAKQNTDLKKTFDNLVNSFVNTLTIFEPVLKGLAWILGGINTAFKWVGDMFDKMHSGLGGVVKAMIAGFVLFALSTKMLGGSIGQLLGGAKEMVMGGGKKLLGLGKGIMSKGGESTLPGADVADKGKGMTKGIGEGIKGFFKGFAEGIKAFGEVSPAALLKFALSLVIVGGAIIGFSVAMAKFGGEAGVGQMVTAAVSLVLLGGAIVLLSKLMKDVDMGGILEGALAMAVIGLALIPFAYSMKIMEGISWETLGKMAVAIVGAALLMAGLSVISEFVLIGALTLAAAGVALLIFAGAMMVAGMAFENIAKIDWNGFSSMGPALLSAIPGMLAFGIASLMFINPFTLLGLTVMTGVLGGLALIMIPLGDAMVKASEGMGSLAGNMEKLQAATDKLSLEKLQQLRELSDSLAGASAAGAVTGAIAALANAISGGGGKGGAGGGETKKIEINLKMNGRDLQTVIINDNELTH